MGIVRKPDVVDYWSEDQVLKTSFFWKLHVKR
jgi:hypothetical protein